MAINQKVEQFMQIVVDEINDDLKSEERIRKFHLCYQPWDIETEELTYTLKLRRAVILEKFGKEIEKMYS